MMPDPHRVVTEHNPLAIDSNFGQLISSAEFGRQAAKRTVVISFNHVDMAADNPIPITPRLFFRRATTFPKQTSAEQEAQLDELVDDALTDAYSESEQVTGFYTRCWRMTYVCPSRRRSLA
jgi:hypothetical protein